MKLGLGLGIDGGDGGGGALSVLSAAITTINATGLTFTITTSEALDSLTDTVWFEGVPGTITAVPTAQNLIDSGARFDTAAQDGTSHTVTKTWADIGTDLATFSTAAGPAANNVLAVKCGVTTAADGDVYYASGITPATSETHGYPTGGTSPDNDPIDTDTLTIANKIVVCPPAATVAIEWQTDSVAFGSTATTQALSSANIGEVIRTVMSVNGTPFTSAATNAVASAAKTISLNEAWVKQVTSAGSPQTSRTATFAGSAAAGDLLVACACAVRVGSAPLMVITDNIDGATGWTAITTELNQTNDNVWLVIWIKEASGGETAITNTPWGSTECGIFAAAYTPSSAATFAVDGSVATAMTSGTNPTPGTNAVSADCVLNIGFLDSTAPAAPTAAGTPAHSAAISEDGHGVLRTLAIEVALNVGAATAEAAWTDASSRTYRAIGVGVKAT